MVVKTTKNPLVVPQAMWDNRVSRQRAQAVLLEVEASTERIAPLSLRADTNELDSEHALHI